MSFINDLNHHITGAEKVLNEAKDAEQKKAAEERAQIVAEAKAKADAEAFQKLSPQEKSATKITELTELVKTLNNQVEHLNKQVQHQPDLSPFDIALNNGMKDATNVFERDKEREKNKSNLFKTNQDNEKN